jgi:hypothetical protein
LAVRLRDLTEIAQAASRTSAIATGMRGVCLAIQVVERREEPLTPERRPE